MVWEHNQNEAKKEITASDEDRFYQYSLCMRYSLQRICACLNLSFLFLFTDKESGRIIANTHPGIDHKTQILLHHNPEYPTYATRTRISTV